MEGMRDDVDGEMPGGGAAAGAAPADAGGGVATASSGGGGSALGRLFRSSRTRRNDEAVEQLLAMGFERAQAEEAIAQVGPDPNRAVDYILGDHGIQSDEEPDDEALAGGPDPGGGAAASIVGADAAEALIRALDSPDQTDRLRGLFESLQREQDGGDVQWGQLLQVLLSRVQPVERNEGATEEQVSAALPETEMTEELLSAHGDDGGECACPLCMESIDVGQRVARLPCGHLYHRSPALPTGTELPTAVTVNGHDCTLVSFEQLSYSAWICDVCLRNQGKGGTFFHDGPIGTPNDNGFDCCVRCAQKHAVLGEEMASVCGGIDAWLMTTPNCPTCRAAVLPSAAEAKVEGGGADADQAAPLQQVATQTPAADSAVSAEMADLADVD
jgi:hypothetical protein